MQRPARNARILSASVSGLLFLAIGTSAVAPWSGVAAEPKFESIETPYFRFSVAPASGACELVDKTAAVTWRSDPAQPRFGWVRFNFHDQSRRSDLGACQIKGSGNELLVSFTP